MTVRLTWLTCLIVAGLSVDACSGKVAVRPTRPSTLLDAGLRTDSAISSAADGGGHQTAPADAHVPVDANLPAVDAGTDAASTASCLGGMTQCNGQPVCLSEISSRDSCGCARQACSGQLCIRGACVGSVDGSPSVGDPWAADDQDAYNLQYLSPITAWRFADSAPTLTRTVVGQAAGMTASSNSQLVLDAQYLYFALEHSSGRTVLRMAKSGGAAETLATEGTTSIGYIGIAVDASYVYWTGEGGVYRVPLSGGSAQLWFGLACADRLAVAGGWAYLMCGDNHEVFRLQTSQPAGLDPSTMTPFATNYFPSNYVYGWGGPVTDGDHVYYLDHNTLQAVTLSTGASASYPLPVAKLASVHVEGTRLFAVAQLTTTGPNVLLLFPKLGDPSFELLGGAGSELDQVNGASGSWLFLQSGPTLWRIAKP